MSITLLYQVRVGFSYSYSPEFTSASNAIEIVTAFSLGVDERDAGRRFSSTHRTRIERVIRKKYGPGADICFVMFDEVHPREGYKILIVNSLEQAVAAASSG